MTHVDSMLQTGCLVVFIARLAGWAGGIVSRDVVRSEMIAMSVSWYPDASYIGVDTMHMCKVACN